MKYTSSIQLKKADTEGHIPASIVDEYVRQELIRQVGIALKPYLSVQERSSENDRLNAHANLINFTTELVVLSVAELNCFTDQLSDYFRLIPVEERHRLQTLIDTLEKT